MRSERYDYANGTTYCPACGEVHAHAVRTRLGSGYPDRVECCGCHHVWTWPSPAEFARRKAERRERERAKWMERYATDPEYRERERERKRAWARENPDKNAECSRRYYDAHLRAQPRTCLWCGGQFRGNGTTRFCSDACRKASRRQMGGIMATIAKAQALQKRIEGTQISPAVGDVD